MTDTATPDEETPAAVPGEPPAEGNHHGVVLLLTLAAIIGALIGGRAALLNDAGGDQLGDAVNADVRRGARIVGDVRRLYEEDASVALRVAEMQYLGEELSAVADEQSSDQAEAILRGEAEANAFAAESLASTSALLDGDTQAAAQLDGDDLLVRLALIRSERSAELKALDPDAVQADAEEQLAASSRLMALLVIVAMAFLFGALAEVQSGSRRLLLTGGYACLVLAGVAALVVEATR